MSRELIQMAQGIVNTTGQGHVYPFYAIKAMEDEIERRGLIKQYVAAVWSAIGQAGHNGEGPNIWKEEWALIRATPEQKAAAFLEAIR